MPTSKRSERERIDTGTDSRYVRRDAKGQFTESDDVGRSQPRDKATSAETDAERGQGDRGDHSDR
jgi:hypothetical protein